VTRLTGLRVSEALLTYARRNNVTRIIIGKPTHSRLRDRLGGSLLDDVVRGSGEIDVHVISGDDSTEARAPAPPPVSPRVPPEHYLAATAIVGVTLGIAMLLRELFQLPDLEMLFLLAVMAVAGLFGQRPAVLAAALGVACYDFFFVPPFHTFSVEDRRYLLTFGMMFAVGLVMSELATRLRRQERLASGREERTAALYALTRELASAEQPQDIAASAARHVANSFRARVVVLAPALDGVLTPLAAAGSDAALEASDLAVAKWTFEHGQLAGLGTDTLPGSKAVAMPLQAGSSLLGVLVLVPTEQGALRADQRDLLDVFSRQVAVSLERARLSEEAKTAALRARTEEMRSSLLSAVSHDLRTPLASITGAATVLRDEPDLERETKSELVESIVDQAERMERLVGNLLDMTRLESAGITLRKDWVPLDEIIGSALTRLETRLGDRAVNVDIAPDVPLVFVDPVLLGQLFLNLLENAIKYTPPSTAIGIRAVRVGEQVTIDVYDHGPGAPCGRRGGGLRQVLPRAAPRRAGGRAGSGDLPRGRQRARRHHPRREPAGGRSGVPHRPAQRRHAPRPLAPHRRHAMSDAGALVLVVEDEPQMRKFIRASLRSHGYRVIEAERASEALMLITSQNPELVLLDLGLPDGDGIDVTKQVREWSAVPIIVISARGREDDKVAALDAGADDYLTKPFGVNELLARMRVALRHAQTAGASPPLQVLEFDGLKIDLGRREVTRGAEPIHLTPIEYKLLVLFAQHAGKVLTHRHILKEVWGPAYATQTHYVRVHMAELRKKVEVDPTRPGCWSPSRGSATGFGIAPDRSSTAPFRP
jgi:DNA-binding response OmpR family regulator